MTEGKRLWKLTKELTEVIYATHPSERLGLCGPIIEEEFPHMPPRTVDSITNTILRFVMWMCEQDSLEHSPPPPGPDLEKLAYLYEVEKLSGYEIAEKLNIPRGSIYKFLDDAQVEMRSRSEAQKLVDKPHMAFGGGARRVSPQQGPSEPR